MEFLRQWLLNLCKICTKRAIVSRQFALRTASVEGHAANAAVVVVRHPPPSCDSSPAWNSTINITHTWSYANFCSLTLDGHFHFSSIRGRNMKRAREIAAGCEPSESVKSRSHAQRQRKNIDRPTRKIFAPTCRFWRLRQFSRPIYSPSCVTRLAPLIQ
jgi:hypothetical protein